MITRLRLVAFVLLINVIIIYSFKIPFTSYKLNRNSFSLDFLRHTKNIEQTFTQQLNFIISTKQREDTLITNEDIDINSSNTQNSAKIDIDNVIIREANVQDISAIVNLRIAVFYPEVLLVRIYITSNIYTYIYLLLFFYICSKSLTLPSTVKFIQRSGNEWMSSVQYA